MLTPQVWVFPCCSCGCLAIPQMLTGKTHTCIHICTSSLCLPCRCRALARGPVPHLVCPVIIKRLRSYTMNNLKEETSALAAETAAPAVPPKRIDLLPDDPYGLKSMLAPAISPVNFMSPTTPRKSRPPTASTRPSSTHPPPTSRHWVAYAAKPNSSSASPSPPTGSMPSS